MISDKERAEIGNRVAAARREQGWPKEAAAHEAGVSSITWTRVERGQNVRDDSLAKIVRYVERKAAEPPLAVQEATDEQLINELARRLAAGRQPHAPIATRRRPEVTVTQDEASQTVSARPARDRNTARRSAGRAT